MLTRRLSAALLLAGLIGFSAAGQTPPTGSSSPPADPPKAPTTARIPEKAYELFNKKEYEAAYDVLKEAAKTHPMAPHPRVQLATMFFENREGQNARMVLETAAAEFPKHPDVYLTNASWAYAEGRMTDAILNLQVALKCADETIWNADQRARFARDARTGLAYCFEVRKDWNAAKEHVDALIAAEPKNTTYRVRQGVLMFHDGKHDNAFAAFTQAYKDDPTVDPPELRMAMLWTGSNDSNKTEEWLKKAMAAHPKDARVHRGYAVFMLNEHRLTDADTYLKSAEAAATQPSRDTQYLRGLYYRYIQKWGEAEKIFDELNRKSPADIEAAAQLALSLAESTDKVKMERGIQLAETVVQRATQQGGGYEVLGWCYYKYPRLDDAEKALNTVATRGGGRFSLDGAYFFSRVLYDRGKYEDAYKILKGVTGKDVKGQFVYKSEAMKLFDEVGKKLPPEKKEDKKDPPKKDDKK